MVLRASGVVVAVAAVAVGATIGACVRPRPDRVMLSEGERVPAALSRWSREDLADYYARTDSTVETGTSVSILGRIVDRSYVHAAVRERALEGHWSRERARRELATAEAYYLDGRLSFEIEVDALVESGMSSRRFADIRGWQWTLVVDGAEPLVSTDAFTTRRRMFREQGGGGYFQGRAFVPEPVYVLEHHTLKGVVRFGPPAPRPRRTIALRAYPPGLPAVLRLRWRVARGASRGA